VPELEGAFLARAIDLRLEDDGQLFLAVAGLEQAPGAIDDDASGSQGDPGDGRADPRADSQAITEELADRRRHHDRDHRQRPQVDDDSAGAHPAFLFDEDA
jgi:hypothetical protein